jgi:hypothetical protein
MATKTESVKVAQSTMRQYRKWAKNTGRRISFLVNAALVSYLLRHVEERSKEESR